MFFFLLKIRRNRASTNLCIRTFIPFIIYIHDLLQRILYDVKFLGNYTYSFFIVNCEKTSVFTLNSYLLKVQY